MAAVCLKKCIYIYIYISTKKRKTQIKKNIPTFLKVTIKGFNVDTYYFISAKYEMYNKALSLYFIPPFEQFSTFFLVNTSRLSCSC